MGTASDLHRWLHDDDHEVIHLGHDRAEMSRRTLLKLGSVGLGAVVLASCGLGSGGSAPTGGDASSRTDGAPGRVIESTTGIPAGFEPFLSKLSVTRDGDYWLVESDGMPDRSMMVGIRNWQQQVPLPQAYTGANGWRFPAQPRLSANPVSARNALYRGAIALSVEGIPIFNALNNRGEDAHLLGELDEWGGHSGRADDYHYHAAPLHLQSIVGDANPIAYALDGFAIYGSVEPDGSPVATLDEFNGHVGSDGVYHYHGTTTFPYMNGGLRGEVTIKEDAVEPQPRLTPLRPAGSPLPNARIVAFDAQSGGRNSLTYRTPSGDSRIDYVISSDQITFTYVDPSGSSRTEVYRRR